MTEPEKQLPEGFRAAGLWCGIKQPHRPDLGLLIGDDAFPATALFTRSKMVGACVTLSRENLARSGGLVRAILVNSGNANCATGAAGLEDGRMIGAAMAELIGCPPEQVLFLNTGVIGQRLPVEPILANLDALHSQARQGGLDDFSSAILTTDTRPKVAIDGEQFTGIAKGSGMIHPDMATMLAFAMTDAAHTDLGAALDQATDRTFHRLTVDGDTSPNDAVILWSSGRRDADGDFDRRLEGVCRDLCRQIAADGEGATKLVTIRVSGATSEHQAATIGRTIATSMLTKTAIAGRDPNWGRIVAAAARTSGPVDVSKFRLAIGGAVVFDSGQPHPENEPAAHQHMLTSDEVDIDLVIGEDPHAAECWTCDLTADYVKINADYRT